MSFTNLRVRYQTAHSLPAPYAYFYTLTAVPTGAGVQVDLAVTYPDRDDIDDDELIAEGFTRDDDFTWSGRLPRTWLEAFDSLAAKTRLQSVDEEELAEDDDFWDITIETTNGSSKQGTPQKADEWQYTMQELMQASFEAMERERPFELTFVDNSSQGTTELRLTAAFADRSVKLLTLQDRRERSQPLPWATLQRVMSQVYEHDFDPELTQLKRPSRSGQWLNLGTEEWYDVSRFKKLIKGLTDL